MLRSLSLLLSGNAASSVVSFARNLLVARLVSVENYGIAATFALTMSVVELASNLGLQQLIIQNRNGDDPAFQDRLQGFHLMRSVVGAAVLFLLAGPIARFLSVPDVAWAYRLLAIIPVLNGIQHFDVHRFMRRQSFLPIVAFKFLPATVGLLAVWPLYYWVGGFQVMLYSLILQWAAAALVSHLLAERRYGIVFEAAFLRLALAFGWPLLINNILFFGVTQGDRVIVGGRIGIEELAVFSMGLTLTMTPSMILGGSIGQLVLPRMSREQGAGAVFSSLTIGAIEASLLVGLAFVVFIALFGQPLVHVLLGPRYEAVVPLLVWFAIQQSVRIARTGIPQAAVARAKTTIPMFANIARVVALVPAWLVAIQSGSLVAIIQIGLAGEVAAFVVSLGLARVKLGVRLRPLVWPLATSAAVFAAAAVHSALSGESGVPMWVGDVGLLVLLGIAAASLKTLWGFVATALSRAA